MKKYILLLLLALSAFATTEARNKTYVVVVGISNYRYPSICPSLRGLTLKSARLAANFFDHNGHSDTYMLLDGNATRDHIIRVMKSQFAKADRDDIVMFIFSGHGYPGGLTTYGFDGTARTAVTYEEVQNIMKSCRASRKIILTEACYSGGIKENKYNKKTNRNNSLYRKPTSTEVLVYTSSRANEVSYVPGFMECLVKGLSGSADSNRDRKVTAKELFVYVNHQVALSTQNRQHPQMWGNFNDNMIISYY